MTKDTKDKLNQLVLGVGMAALMLGVAILTVGCASWGDYASEVRTVNATISADKKAERDREQKEEDRYMAAMQAAQSDVARVAMAGFWALTKARGGADKGAAGYLVPTPPKDHFDSLIGFAGATLPTVAQVALGVVNANTAKRQSDNQAAIALSTNSAFVALGQESGSTARSAMTMIPGLQPNQTFTIGGSGVIGSGTYTATTTTTSTTNSLTAGADGVQGAGTITKPANVPTVCTVGATGALSCH